MDMSVGVRRLFSVGLVLLCAAVDALALASAPALAAESQAAPQGCPNEQLRAEQPFGLTLPDCRAYEMVSPVETNGQDAVNLEDGGAARAAVSGEAITYASRGSFADPTGATAENQFISHRSGEEDRWETRSITPLHDPVGTEKEPPYTGTAFTPELTAGVANTNSPLVAGASGGKGEGEFGLYVESFASDPFSYRYVGEVGAEAGAFPLGASTDLSHVAFGASFGRVSEWVDGEVVPVSVSNGGASMEASVGAGLAYPSYVQNKELWHAVSADGSRVYFTSPATAVDGQGPVYVRVNAEREQSKTGPGGEAECIEAELACTIAVSPGAARYWGASADGTRMFYSEGEDLYEYSLPLGRLEGRTTALTGAGKVQGVVQISEDGSYVYFVADAALAAGASEQQCREETPEERSGEDPKQENLGCNLYVYHGGETTFVAKLAANDRSDWHNALAGYPEVEAGPEINTAVLSPDGSRLAFASEQELPTVNFPAGYDNTQARPGECEGYVGQVGSETETGRCREIYLYDAGSGGAESLVCASCDPSGARPVGPSNLGVARSADSEYRARNLLADGTLYFDSSDELVPEAGDGRQNVYEFQDGHTYAISNVAGGYESLFLDAAGGSPGGEEGTNVFFASADRLLSEDTSDSVVLYDARVDGGFPAPATAPSCDNGDSCKPPPSPQPSVFAPAGSATFSGPGDTTPPVVKPVVKKKAVKCKRGKKLSHNRCVQKKKPKKSRAIVNTNAKGRKKHG
jgi:hypothetical protein